MELRCYSYDGGAPPMDSWSLEEKMGVVKQAALRGLIKAIRPPGLVLHWAATMCWVGLVQHLTTVYAISLPFEIIVGYGADRKRPVCCNWKNHQGLFSQNMLTLKVAPDWPGYEKLLKIRGVSGFALRVIHKAI